MKFDNLFDIENLKVLVPQKSHISNNQQEKNILYVNFGEKEDLKPLKDIIKYEYVNEVFSCNNSNKKFKKIKLHSTINLYLLCTSKKLLEKELHRVDTYFQYCKELIKNMKSISGIIFNIPNFNLLSKNEKFFIYELIKFLKLSYLENKIGIFFVKFMLNNPDFKNHDLKIKSYVQSLKDIGFKYDEKNKITLLDVNYTDFIKNFMSLPSEKIIKIFSKLKIVELDKMVKNELLDQDYELSSSESESESEKENENIFETKHEFKNSCELSPEGII